ncbi:glycine-rich domain-containing protein [Amycolatopsis sp. NPDC059027]|uniref:glycine-rich domain-containing protein n=1 Tax=unclassified Amycolatopsis TaxID=2618356 RepID=UPI00366F04BE
MTIAVEHLTGQGLVSEVLFRRLANRIIEKEGISTGKSERIVDQALAFLAACGKATEPLAPSETVDIGWHTFILYTREYVEFCDRIAGRFIHHVPDDENEKAPKVKAQDQIGRTVKAIRAAGFYVDEELWVGAHGVVGSCTGCHNGCHEDPPPPPATMSA